MSGPMVLGHFRCYTAISKLFTSPFLLPLPRQPLYSSLGASCHLEDTTQGFLILLFSRSMFSLSVHVVARVSIHNSFFWLSNIHCMIYHILFIPLSVSGHLGCFSPFWLLWIMLLWTFIAGVCGGQLNCRKLLVCPWYTCAKYNI